MCFMADEDVAAEAKETGQLQELVASMDKAARLFGGGDETLYLCDWKCADGAWCAFMS